MSKRSKAEVNHAVNLLWTHQMRRENAFLQKEIERLREDTKAVSTQLKQVSDRASTAHKAAKQSSSAIVKAEKVQLDLATTLSETVNKVEQIADQSALLKADLDNVKLAGEQSSTKATLAIQQVHHKHQEATKERLSKKTDTAQVHSLENRVDALQARLGKCSEYEQSIEVIVDSFEGGQPSGSPQDLATTRQIDKLPTSLRPSAVKVLAPPPEQVTDGEILTLRPNDATDESTESEDFDLDQCADKVEQHMRQAVPPATFLSLLSLKQGRFQSWDLYFADGESFFKTLAREKELWVVTAFLEGLFDGRQRRQCQQWLNLNGWTWASISSFTNLSTPAGGLHHSLMSDATRVPSPLKAVVSNAQTEESGERAQQRRTPPEGRQQQDQNQQLAERSVIQMQTITTTPDIGPHHPSKGKCGSLKQTSKDNSQRSMKMRLEKELKALEQNSESLLWKKAPRASAARQEGRRNRKPSHGSSQQAPLSSSRETGPPAGDQRQAPDFSIRPARPKTPSPFRSIQPTPRLTATPGGIFGSQEETDPTAPTASDPNPANVE
ncbi:hypothetical protein DV736_g16, partial [Chaetothyriales sp. CBS 134916]